MYGIKEIMEQIYKSGLIVWRDNQPALISPPTIRHFDNGWMAAKSHPVKFIIWVIISPLIFFIWLYSIIFPSKETTGQKQVYPNPGGRPVDSPNKKYAELDEQFIRMRKQGMTDEQILEIMLDDYIFIDYPNEKYPPIKKVMEKVTRRIDRKNPPNTRK